MVLSRLTTRWPILSQNSQHPRSQKLHRLQTNRTPNHITPIAHTWLEVTTAMPSGMEFDPTKPYRACMLCGDIFQDDNPQLRQEWASQHASTHSLHEHAQHAMSGRFLTPEAAHKLAAFGVVPVQDALSDKEIEDALLSAPASPLEDVEFLVKPGTRRRRLH